jgi:hypothetical protein
MAKEKTTTISEQIHQYLTTYQNSQLTKFMLKSLSNSPIRSLTGWGIALVEKEASIRHL